MYEYVLIKKKKKPTVLYKRVNRTTVYVSRCLPFT